MESTNPLGFAAGELLAGRYELISRLGQGGMSVVYRVRDLVDRREVALKALRISNPDQANFLYIQQEFRAMSRLRHPRLVQVYNYGVLETCAPFFTMEMLTGTDLSNLPRLPIPDVYHILVALADVLSFMHVRGYVHRDVKPANVRILPREAGSPIRIRLMDCGLAELVGESGSNVAGTLPYLAPEAHYGASSSIRADLYAFGVLAYEITAGRLPFEGSTAASLLKSKLTPLRDIRDFRDDVPLPFVRLIEDLLDVEPANRPSSASEVLARLAQLVDTDTSPDPEVYLRAPALVGRTEELQHLRNVLRAAEDGQPGLVAVVALAGAGKSRLCEDAVLEARLRSNLIAQTRGRGFGAAAYESLHQLLRVLVHAPDGPEILDSLQNKAALAPVLPGFQKPLEAPSDPIVARSALHRAFIEFVSRLSKIHPIVFYVDDLHLTDAASLDALTALFAAKSPGRVALLGAMRQGEPTSVALDRLLALGPSLELPRMTDVHVGELIHKTLGVANAPASLLSDISRYSEGNIYFILEILRSAVANGLITRKRSSVELPANLDSSQVPSSLASALDSRVATLSADGLLVAQCAAVLERPADFGILQAISGLVEDRFFDAIDELRRSEVLDLNDRLAMIHHPHLREILYQGINEEQRQRMHLRTAQELQLRLGRNANEQAAVLGQHFALAKDRARAFKYLVMAGNARYDTFAFFDAGEAYRRAIVFLDACPAKQRVVQECRLNDRLGRIGFYHDHHNAFSYLFQARQMHLQHGLLWAITPLSQKIGPAPATVVAIICTIIWNALHLHRHPIKETLAHLFGSFAAWTCLCNCYTYTGRFADALEKAEQLLPFDISHKRLTHAGYLLSKAPALNFTGRYKEAAEACEEALRIVETDKHTPMTPHDLVHAKGGALVTRLWSDLSRGWIAKTDWWEKLEQFVLANPSALLDTWWMEARVYLAFRQGDLRKTVSTWQEFVDKSQLAEVQFVQDKGRVWLAMAYLQDGRISEAQDLADKVIGAAQAAQNPMLQALGLLVRSLAQQGWGHIDDARKSLVEALELVRRPDVGCVDVEDQILAAQAQLHLDCEELDQAAELAQALRDRHGAPGRQPHFVLVKADRILACVALKRGFADLARTHLEAATALADALHDEIERAVCRHFLSHVSRAAGDVQKADEQAQDCEQMLTMLGNSYMLRRLGYRDPTSKAIAKVSRPEFRNFEPTAETAAPESPKNADWLENTLVSGEPPASKVSPTHGHVRSGQ